MLQGLRRLRKSEVFTFRTFGVPRGSLNPLRYSCVCCPLGRREFFSGFFFGPGRPGGPSIRCTITVFAALWAGASFFLEFFFRPGRPGGPSIGCSILMFAAMWVPPAVCAVSSGAPRLFFFSPGRSAGPSIGCSILRFAAMWVGPGPAASLPFRFRAAPRALLHPSAVPGGSLGSKKVLSSRT